MVLSEVELGRRAHYRRFYDADPPPGDELIVVLGNCQAESVRLLLDPDGIRSVRLPPIFELDGDDLPLLRRLLGRATALVTQPVRADYRGHRLGTEQLAAHLPTDGRLVRFPIVRYAGLHPCHVVVHSTTDESGRPVALPQPPIAAYHDLRTVADALGHRVRELQPQGVRAVARASVAELQRREARTDVAVSAVLAHPGPEHMRTVNHPGNPVLLALAAGVATVLGMPAPQDPGRPLLDAIRAPIERVAARAWGLTPHPAPPTWCIEGRRTTSSSIAERHRSWYATHPEVAAAVWQRHRATAELLGLM